MKLAQETVVAMEKKDEEFGEQDNILVERIKGIYGSEVPVGSVRDCFGGDGWDALTGVREDSDDSGDSTSLPAR